MSQSPQQKRISHENAVTSEALGQGKMKEPRYKRPLDLVVLLLGHLLLLPLWLVLWTVIPLIILMDNGLPIFYGQRRVGRGGRLFHALKFRTMVKNADRLGPAWTTDNDPRLTRAGRLLRQTALDELPQVLNILRGEMSFVGPRALAEQEHYSLKEQIPSFDQRLSLRPGLTGLAQVHTSRHDSQKKLVYDLEYAQTMSLWLDVKLLSLSVWVTLRAKWGGPAEQAAGAKISDS